MEQRQETVVAMPGPGRKRTAEEAFVNPKMADSKQGSPFLPMFEGFRTELDEHHDRRERIIKASRDVTAASKKIIFSLQRIRRLNEPIPQGVQKANQQYWNTIQTQYKNIARDLQGINAYRYNYNITPGNQEFMEAMSFQYYLETQQLIPYEEAMKKLAELSGEGCKIPLTIDDYLLGIFDMVGELMRFSITAMATSGELPGRTVPKEPKPQASSTSHDSEMTEPGTEARNVLTDLRELRTHLEKLDVSRDSYLGRDVGKKMGVMQTCVGKVENALYGLIVRGSERPKGWMPDLSDRGRDEMEVF